MAIVNLYTLGQGGYNSDVPSHELPPEMFNQSMNFTFRRGKAEHRADNRFLGFTETFGNKKILRFGSIFYIPTVDWVLVGAEVQFTSGSMKDTTYFTVIQFELDDRGLRAPYDIYPLTSTNRMERYAWNSIYFQFRMFNKTPIFLPSGFPPMYWDTTAHPDTNIPTETAQVLPGYLDKDDNDKFIIGQDADDNPYVPQLIAVVGSFIVAMNFPDQPSKVRWSSAAGSNFIPNSWVIDDPTLEGGETILSKGGEIVGAELLGDVLYIFQRNYIQAMSFIGGIFIFNFREVIADRGVFTRNSITRIANRSLYFITQNDILEFNGQTVSSIIEGVCREELFNLLQVGDPELVWAQYSTTAQEYYLYPGVGHEAFVYSTQYGVWSKSSKAARLLTCIEFQTLIPANLHLAFQDLQDKEEIPNNPDTLDYTFAQLQARGDRFSTWGTDITNVGTRFLVGPWRITDRYPWLGFGVIEGADTYQRWPDHRGQGVGDVDNRLRQQLSRLERHNLALVGRGQNGSPKVDLQTKKQVTEVWWRGVGNWRVAISMQDSQTPQFASELEWDISEAGYPLHVIPRSGRYVSIRWIPIDDPGVREELHGYDFDLFNAGRY